MGMIRRALAVLLLAPLAYADDYSATGLTAGTTYRACGAWQNEADTPLTATIVCSDQWATTAAGDTTPDAYTFLDVAGQPLDSLIASNIITVTGIDASTVVTISGEPSCEFSINGGTATSAESSITNGQTLQLFVRTESLGMDQFTCAPMVGGVSDTSGSWSVTTRPDTFITIALRLVRSLVQTLVGPLIGTGD